jgi:hypothetical protein
MGDHVHHPEYYAHDDGDKTYFYLLVGVSIAMLALVLANIA